MKINWKHFSETTGAEWSNSKKPDFLAQKSHFWYRPTIEYIVEISDSWYIQGSKYKNTPTKSMNGTLPYRNVGFMRKISKFEKCVPVMTHSKKQDTTILTHVASDNKLQPYHSTSVIRLVLIFLWCRFEFWPHPKHLDKPECIKGGTKR